MAAPHKIEALRQTALQGWEIGRLSRRIMSARTPSEREAFDRRHFLEIGSSLPRRPAMASLLIVSYEGL